MKTHEVKTYEVVSFVDICYKLKFDNIRTGRSAAWLARLPWEQEVGRSNRLAPTSTAERIEQRGKRNFLKEKRL